MLLNQATQILIWANLAHPMLLNPPPAERICALNRQLASIDLRYRILPSLGTAIPMAETA